VKRGFRDNRAMPHTIHRPALLAGLASAIGIAAAAGLTDPGAVPHLDARGRTAYRQFLASAPHRAFAIAPGGAWGWAAEAESPELAERQALEGCQANTRQACQAYALDDRVVLDPGAWARAWGPYATAAQASRAPTGMQRGERFPDLLFRDAGGRPLMLSELRGQVVVLHFWGSWCPPCQREMPDLARLTRAMAKDKAVRFVFLQVREDFAVARRWADRLAKGLPLYDSGMKSGSDSAFTLADGGRLADRAVAMAFPTTYVLDRHGLVLFSHVGPVAGWDQYIPFLRDAAARSGR
jgi:thiol-disulfide isomerase/thioredoxin